MARVGVFGGTFNPVHAGHKNLIDQIKRKKKLDKVLIIPTNLPPHKKCEQLASNLDRLEMCRLVFDADDGYIISDLEYKLGGDSYTVRTLEHLRERFPDDQLFLIIGSDMLYTFELWRDYKIILKQAAILAGSREADEYEKMQKKAEWLNQQGGSVEIVPVDVIDVSSSQIRFCTKEMNQYIDSKVFEYIKSHSLYSFRPMDLHVAREIAKQNLKSKRYTHSVNVAKEAVSLAKHYGADIYKAELAGVLHDIMKNKEPDYLLQYFDSNVIILSKIEQNSPKLWHAIAGAVFVQKELKIDDQQVINAIRYHTTARAGMSLLEKIIFVADCISCDRNYQDVDKVRELAYQSLDKTILFHMQYTICKLTEKLRYLHPDSIHAYNALIELYPEGING